MALTSTDINNQSFSVDRKGYNVDEVDVFLEHVAEEVDMMNAEIVRLEEQLNDAYSNEGDDRFSGFDTAVIVDDEKEEAPVPATADEKDALIADLQRQLDEKRANDDAIARALVAAQRTADDIISKAKAEAAEKVKDAEREAERIVGKAEMEKQRVAEATRKLESDREEVRDNYEDMLNEFISSASRCLAEIGGSKFGQSAHVRFESGSAMTAVANSTVSAPVQAPAKKETAAYVVPQAISGPASSAAVAIPSTMEKDFSGYGEADAGFEFEDID